jgi:hypothetical protein
MTPDKIRVQVVFKKQVDVKGQKIDYCDAFYFTQEDYAKLDEKTLQGMKDERVAGWKTQLENPPPAYEPTEADLVKEKEAIEAQVAELQTRLSETTEKIDSMKVMPVKDR